MGELIHWLVKEISQVGYTSVFDFFILTFLIVLKTVCI